MRQEFFEASLEEIRAFGNRFGAKYKGGSSSNPTTNSTTQYHNTDSRIAATDGAVVATGGSTVNMTTLDPQLAAVGYQVVGGVAQDAMGYNAAVSNAAIQSANQASQHAANVVGAIAANATNTTANVANNAINATTAAAIAGQQINADVSKTALKTNAEVTRDALHTGADLALNLTTAAFDANTKAQELALNTGAELATTLTKSALEAGNKAQELTLGTVEDTVGKTTGLLRDFNEQSEITNRDFIREMGQIHEDNTAFAHNLQVENQKMVKELADSYAAKLANNHASEAVQQSTVNSQTLAYLIGAAAVIAVIFIIFKLSKKKPSHE